MATIGPLIVEPGTGSYCWVTLDSGEQILVNHDTEGAETGCITIEASKAFEFSSDPLFEFDLDSLEGKAALTKLMYSSRTKSVFASPLSIFVEYFKDCGSIAAVKRKCEALVLIG